jgi:hypothetical protein
MGDIVVELDEWECRHATTVGKWRQEANAGRRDAHGFKGDGERIHIEGCLYEYAVARALNLFWSGVRSDPFVLRGDVGSLQVRGTNHRYGHLLLHERDDDDALFVLVIGDSSTIYRLVGWTTGREAKDLKWWSDPTGGRPCFMVPQLALRDPEELVNA